jgi:thiol-disulfide isomerase/thioredoxin
MSTGAGVVLRRLAWLLAPVLLAAGCGGDPGRPAAAEEDPGPPPFAGCAGLSEPPPRAVAGPAVAETGAPDERPAALPRLSLPCYADGAGVQVAELRGPAVVNLWASWCGPCRSELPVLQRFADRTAGRVHVVGVVSGDTRVGSTSLARDLGVRFPALFDPDEELKRALRRPGLPLTLFVDARGGIRHLDDSGALGPRALDRLAERHLGVVP